MKPVIRHLGLPLGCVLLVLAACGGGDPVHEAIAKLDGPPAVQKRAAMELKLTSRDPVPALIDAIDRPSRGVRLRVAAIGVLGEMAVRQNDARAQAFLGRLLDGGDEALRHAAVRALRDTEFTEAIPSLTRIRNESEGELRQSAEKTLHHITAKLVTRIESSWNSPETALAEYQKAEAAGAGRGVLGLSKARFLLQRGRYEEAGALFDALGVIRRWWLLGPFPNNQGRGFGTAYPPEKEIDIQASYPAGTEPANWYRMDTDTHQGFLNFESYFIQTDNVVGYALVFVESETEQPVEIRAGSDDTITIFLNGDRIWSHEQYRALAYDDDVIAVMLKSGANVLLFKVCEDWGDWALTARVTAPADTPLHGVRIILDPPPGLLPFTAEKIDGAHEDS